MWGGGLEEWVAEGGHRVVGWGVKGWVISTKSVPYDTHSHGLSGLSLSVCLSPHLSLFSWGWGKRGGGEGGKEVGISQPQRELCDDRGQAMSHTRDSSDSPYHTERASLNTPLLSLPISLCLGSLTKTTHYCWRQIHLLHIENTSRTAAQTDTIMTMHKHQQKMKSTTKQQFCFSLFQVIHMGRWCFRLQCWNSQA